jgi:hypothetical protein
VSPRQPIGDRLSIVCRLSAIEAALEERAGGVYGIKGPFLFTPLRGHPRFDALLRRMNLGD